MNAKQVIPILRIFDYQKTLEFYIGWMGFEIVWEHHFEENTPVLYGGEKRQYYSSSE